MATSPKNSKKKKKMVQVTKNKKMPAKKVRKLEKKAGSSNIGEYPRLKASEFAGPAGGAAPGTYPINTKKRAKAALAYAHNAPKPAGIRRAVYKKYPELKPEKKRGAKKK